uniref:Gamma-secretase subunit PEN-2 n=1 Tax=Zonotrichia albicollis TaxID=44394 RepID=A0A8D2M2H8_ZONAL
MSFTGPYRFVPVHTGPYWSIIMVHTGLYWSVLVHTGLYWFVPVQMNLERVSNEEKLQLCRKYYLGGFLLLPFLWLVNVVWFFRPAFLAPPFGEQPRIKTCERGKNGG